MYPELKQRQDRLRPHGHRKSVVCRQDQTENGWIIEDERVPSVHATSLARFLTQDFATCKRVVSQKQAAWPQGPQGPAIAAFDALQVTQAVQQVVEDDTRRSRVKAFEALDGISDSNDRALPKASLCKVSAGLSRPIVIHLVRDQVRVRPSAQKPDPAIPGSCSKLDDKVRPRDTNQDLNERGRSATDNRNALHARIVLNPKQDRITGL